MNLMTQERAVEVALELLQKNHPKRCYVDINRCGCDIARAWVSLKDGLRKETR